MQEQKGRLKTASALLASFNFAGLVEISDHTSAGRGLILAGSEPSKADELLLRVPSTSLLNVRTAKRWLHTSLLPSKQRPSHPYNNATIEESTQPAPSGCKDIQSETLSGIEQGGAHVPLPLSSHQALALLLAIWKSAQRQPAQNGPHEKSGEGPLPLANTSVEVASPAFLDAFLGTAPASYDTHPLSYSSEPSAGLVPSILAKCLPAHASELVQRVRSRFHRDWSVIEGLQRRHPEMLIPLEAISDTVSSTKKASLPRQSIIVTKEDFKWGWLCVNTRCLHLPQGLTPHADNLTLAPILDLANHKPSSSSDLDACNVRHTPSSGLELHAPSRRGALQPGDQVTFCYGAHAAQMLFAEYGFVLPRERSPSMESGQVQQWNGCPFAEVRLDDGIIRLFKEQGDEGIAKENLLQARGYWLDYTIHPDPFPPHASHRLICALRLLHVPLSSTSVHERSNQNNLVRTYPITSAPFINRSPGRTNAELQGWEATLLGLRHHVSDENEDKAHGTLMKLCQDVMDDRTSRLSLLHSMLQNRHSESLSEASEPVKHASARDADSVIDMVRTMLIDDFDIAQSVLAITRAGGIESEWS
ncbi:N-methyltransferase [Ceraceosorus bombacis]|uniref:N-methyltransferase n=1 Tax=Ceraceosorus bombacis TaxID=401625 RepID=A0A0P1BET8_9BASI|nr:N-methyltransferase [Ceraceosorus bombacis]